MSEKNVHLDELMPVMLERLQQGHKVRLYPRGVSMLPMLRQGIDSVELAPVDRTLKKYDLPLYQRDDGHYVLHRIVKVANTYTCIGDNQFILEKNVRPDQVLAIVTGYYKADTYHSVNSFGYKFYCRFHHWTRFPRHVWVYLKTRMKRIGK